MQVESKDELIALLESMARDARVSTWENETLPEYLEALAAWLNDADGYYQGRRATDVASWRVFGDALQAARVYE